MNSEEFDEWSKSAWVVINNWKMFCKELREEIAALNAQNAALKAAIPDGDGRVYACLTACVGIPTETLEELPGTFGQILKKAKQDHDGLISDRYELVKALREMREEADTYFMKKQIKEADRILAKYQENGE